MASSINVLFITSGLEAGGRERQLIELLKNIDKNVFTIGLVTFGKNHHYSAEAKVHSSYFVELTKRPSRLEPCFTIWKCYREFKPDIVHTWDSLSSMYAWLPCKYYNSKLVDGSIRDAGVDKGWEYLLKRFFLKRSSMIISNSIAGLNAYKTTGRVIYNSIDTSRFIPPKAHADFNLVMTANFSNYKDQQTFLNAAVILVSDHAIDKVYLLGEGPNKNKYINWINREYPEISHRFLFTGAVRNVEEYLSICHIGILCSTPEYGEGLSNAVLEYMAAGLVPIATDIGGSTEIIEDGKNGYLIKPKDHHKIIELVLQLKNNSELRQNIVTCASKTIEEKFTMQCNMGKLVSCYKSLI